MAHNQGEVRAATAIALLVIVRTFLCEPFFIPSASMYPTLANRDQIAVEKFSRLASTPRRGDIVVFRPPPKFFENVAPREAPSNDGEFRNRKLVKRVVAVSGDTVEVRGGVLIVNGDPRYEPFTAEQPRYTMSPTSVPEGTIFVLGDNRNDSDDSHLWGPVPIDNVVGKAFYVLYPPSRQGFIDQFMQDIEVTGDASAFIERARESLQQQPANGIATPSMTRGLSRLRPSLKSR